MLFSHPLSQNFNLNSVDGKGNYFHWAGKLILIKLVRLALPSYLLALIKPPKSIKHEFNRIMANFLLHDKDESHKLHWIKWKAFCLPTAEGILGIRDINDIVKAYSIKLWWRFRQ